MKLYFSYFKVLISFTGSIVKAWKIVIWVITWHCLNIVIARIFRLRFVSMISQRSLNIWDCFFLRNWLCFFWGCWSFVSWFGNSYILLALNKWLCRSSGCRVGVNELHWRWNWLIFRLLRGDIFRFHLIENFLSSIVDRIHNFRTIFS